MKKPLDGDAESKSAVRMTSKGPTASALTLLWRCCPERVKVRPHRLPISEFSKSRLMCANIPGVEVGWMQFLVDERQGCGLAL